MMTLFVLFSNASHILHLQFSTTSIGLASKGVFILPFYLFKTRKLKVLSGITIPELDILDKFEDVEYERRTVVVTLTDSSNTLKVEAYIWADQNDPNLYGEWDFEEWERLHKQSFLKMTREFLEELEHPDQSGSI
ncbi:AIG2-like protein D isoform X2 [Capsicum annuum]|uniref:AIG2-like protein D isoform X2 n=1 Tax=Capsicum annuum TaxID=4072 RepID=UPI0007BFB63F|nr:AIG2-like protein D isoform X2 [Capsicum annuum]